jgi:serine/threonine protein kinase
MTRMDIKYDDLEMGECLGKGFFGEVRRATWQGTDVAVKVIYRKSFRSVSEFELFEKEVAVLRYAHLRSLAPISSLQRTYLCVPWLTADWFVVSLLRHPCIVQFMGVCLGSKNCIITEFMAGTYHSCQRVKRSYVTNTLCTGRR